MNPYKLDMSPITAIITAARAEHAKLNEDLDHMLARAKWKFQMRYPAKKPVLRIVKS